jgi:3-oxoacyl-[acyl-carrier protein] reductase
METLNQKRVLITGAARGLGQALALRLAAEGARLILVDCDVAGLCVTAGLVSESAADVATFECDLTDPQQISQTVARIRERFHGIDVLINNAGVAWYGTVANMSAEEWERVLAVNLLAPIQLIREFLPDLQAQPEAHILNVSSVYGLMATNRATAYHCTKFALVGLSEALRAECDRNGLGVTAFCPGFMQTDLFSPAEDGKPDRRPPAWLCSSTARVADKAVKAILRDRRMVVVSPLAQVLYATRRVFPGLLNSLYRIGRRRKLRERKERISDQSGVEAQQPPSDERRTTRCIGMCTN